MQSAQANQTAAEYDKDVVLKVARAFWVEDFLTRHPGATQKDAYEAWAGVDKKSWQQTIRKTLARLAHDGLRVT